MTVRELLSKLADNPNQFKRENELTRTRFHSMFNRNEVDLDLFWEEYRGILRGYNLNSNSKIINKKDYEDIGRKRGRISPEKRSEFYEIAKEATGKGRRYRESSFTIENTWDELDLCKNVKSNLHANQTYARLNVYTSTKFKTSHVLSWRFCWNYSTRKVLNDLLWLEICHNRFNRVHSHGKHYRFDL